MNIRVSLMFVVLGVSVALGAEASIITDALTFPPRPVGASHDAPVWSVSNLHFPVEFSDGSSDVSVRDLMIVDQTPSVALPAVGETAWGGRQMVSGSGLMRVGFIDGPTQWYGNFDVALRGLDSVNGVHRYEVECRSFILFSLNRPSDVRRSEGSLPVGILTMTEAGTGLYVADLFFTIPVEWSQGDGIHWYSAVSPATLFLVPSPGSLLLIGGLAFHRRRRDSWFPTKP